IDLSGRGGGGVCGLCTSDHQGVEPTQTPSKARAFPALKVGQAGVTWSGGAFPAGGTGGTAAASGGVRRGLERRELRDAGARGCVQRGDLRVPCTDWLPATARPLASLPHGWGRGCCGVNGAVSTRVRNVSALRCGECVAHLAARTNGRFLGSEPP